MWSRLLLERFQVDDERARQLRFHTQTAGSALTAQQPENNAVRVAYQALAAVLGGTQSLHTNSMDEALGLPTEEAAHLALRTQQVLAYETGVTDTVDPLAGSYVIEKLTDELEQRAEAYLQQIEDLGGALSAIEQGFIQREIQESAYESQLAVQDGEQIIVGVNKFEEADPTSIELHRVDPAIEAAQQKHLEQTRAGRDADDYQRSLDQLTKTAQGDENLLPALIHCLESQATIGEIAGRLRQIWGEYQPPATL